MRINHNIASLNTYRALNTNNIGTNKALEKLSSGLRITRAGDDAAGLVISEKMRAQIRGLDQAGRNAQDGISLIQTAEGGLNEIHSILQRMRELADQSVNGTNTNDDRAAINDEFKQLKEEIDRIGNTTEFNTQKLLNGNLQSAGGVIGTNATTGAVVAKLTSGSVTGTAAINTNAANLETDPLAVNYSFIAETVKIDGTDITVNWQNLTTEERATLTSVGADYSSRDAAMNLIVDTINEAIDTSGANVAHVSGYIDSTTGALVIQSGSKGTSSAIAPDTTSNGVLNTILDGTAVPVDGTSKYNGATFAGVTADLKVNGVLMEVTLTANNSADMSTTATALQDAVNASIAAYNGTTGKQSGEIGFLEDVTVTVTDDGRFQINSQSGPVELADRVGQTSVQDLGLSQAQTEAAGSGGMVFQIGANRGQTITFGIKDVRTAALGLTGTSVATATDGSKALTDVDAAIKSVSTERSKMGAVQNRLEHTVNNLQTSAENLTAAESRIRDVDMAKEMMEFTKNNILSQAAQAMLAQANQLPQGVLQLLR